MLKVLKLFIYILFSFSLLFFVSCSSGDNGKKSTTKSLDLTIYEKVALSDEQKYALAFMWNEERLAYDLYTNLYTINGVTQMQNIASKSEIAHINLVRDIVAWYDLNITNLVDYTDSFSQSELDAMPSGIYGIQIIQDLYDYLYASGVASSTASLEVACMVEVVDVNDLDKYILRDGSYKHYWVVDGCCSLGATYCKTTTEYPR